jgi:hypothetical protein
VSRARKVWPVRDPAIYGLDLVGLTALMDYSAGRREIRIELIDGPVALDHPELAADRIEPVADAPGAGCTVPSSAACAHGTFVAGILSGRRGYLLVHPPQHGCDGEVLYAGGCDGGVPIPDNEDVALPRSLTLAQMTRSQKAWSRSRSPTH